MIKNAILLSFMSFILFAGTLVSADTCPDCPQGCMPSAYVEEYRADEETAQQGCPAGCVALDQVKSLRVQPGCQIATGKASAQPEEQKAAEVSIKPAQPQNVRSTQIRGVVFPHALSAPGKEMSFTGWAAGLWDMEYIFSENLQAGAYVVIPVFVAGIAPSIKAQFALSEHFSIGFGALAGIVGSYTGDISDFFAVVFGGHVEGTLHTDAHSLTVGLVVAGAGARGSGDFEMADGAVFLPNISYRFAFHRNWSVQADITGPIIIGKDGVMNDEAIVILFYGFRGHGDTMFGDFGFVLPFCKSFIDDIWRYTPIGIPYFSLGFKF